MRQKEYNDLLSKIKCSDDFRKRMQEKLSAEPVDTSDYEDIVSGTEVITAKHRWGKFAAMAAAVVLICGAVGGGVYHFANMPDNDENIEETINDDVDENAPIYSNLKANKDKYDMDFLLCDNGSVYQGYPKSDKDKFFEYMDKYDFECEVEEGDISRTENSVKASFSENGESIVYVFEIYANGDCTWTEKHGEEERTTYHSLVGGEKVPKDILNMYADEEAIAQFEIVTHTECIKNEFERINNELAAFESIENELKRKSIENELAALERGTCEVS